MAGTGFGATAGRLSSPKTCTTACWVKMPHPNSAVRCRPTGLACETEWIRAERTMAGVLSFCHLTNNYGYTGDWYINHIKDLEPGISLKWFKHAFAPANVFIDLADQRYFPNGFYQPGERLVFNLVGINDLNKKASGKVTIKLIDGMVK
jgi:beta-galactosidase